ncbi:MAG: hypothetical protein ACK5PQ_03260 [Alphaproteobacteria bacterium]
MLRLSFLFLSMGLFVASTAFSFTITNPLKPGSTLVNIGGNVRTLTRSTSCKAKYWGNIQENACACCIIKNSMAPKGQIRYKSDTVSRCLEKKHCSEDTLAQMKKDLEPPYNPNYPEYFITQVIQNSLPIAETGTLGSEFTDKQALTTEGAIQALKVLAAQKKIKHSSKSIEECFQAEALGGGGSQTLRLFMISQKPKCGSNSDTSTKGVYILKELKKGPEEIKNTTIVKQSILGKYNLTNPDRPKDFPAIALDEISFTYKDKKGKAHYLSVLPMAPGDSIFNILKEFSKYYKTHPQKDSMENLIQGKQLPKSTTPQLVRAQHAMLVFGSQLGKLHAAHMTRDPKGRLSGKSHAVHGDLHAHNVFEDIDHNIIFIDGETFARGVESPRAVGKDLLRIYLFSTIRNASKHNPRKGNVGQTYWHEQIIKPFLLGYVHSYAHLDGSFNLENLEDVMRILRKTFSLAGSTSEVEGFLKAGPIKALWAYRKYITKILNEIEAEIKKNPKAGGLSPQTQIILEKRKPS